MALGGGMEQKYPMALAFSSIQILSNLRISDFFDELYEFGSSELEFWRGFSVPPGAHNCLELPLLLWVHGNYE